MTSSNQLPNFSGAQSLFEDFLAQQLDTNEGLLNQDSPSLFEKYLNACADRAGEIIN